MQHLEGSGTPVLYIGRTVLKGEYSKILHGVHIAFMCFVRLSQQKATFALHNISRPVLYNRGGECLQRGTD